MLFAAATDHRFLDVGHTLDFTNKALEALDELEWENNKSLVESVLTSLVRGYATAERMEESGSWRHPIDLVTILENAFKELPVALDNGKRIRATIQREQKTEGKQPKQRLSIDNPDRDALVAVLLGDDPQSIVNAPSVILNCIVYYCNNGDNTLLDEKLEQLRSIDAISK